MASYKHLFAAAIVGTLGVRAISSNGAAQQTTKDGIRVENAVNKLERPYRSAGSSDPRDDGPLVAKGFGKRDRRLVYVALPGGEPVRRRLPERRAGKARQPHWGGEQQVTDGRPGHSRWGECSAPSSFIPMPYPPKASARRTAGHSALPSSH